MRCETLVSETGLCFLGAFISPPTQSKFVGIKLKKHMCEEADTALFMFGVK